MTNDQYRITLLEDRVNKLTDMQRYYDVTLANQTNAISLVFEQYKARLEQLQEVQSTLIKIVTELAKR